eukprot:CAMPEP_0197295608 /NCGR_PEP_ID=MMETSP0890-20130614/36012_1 /TAXON_ID=44058 ORGANISM="Aureoumbra lagunensis, Strain CCMP1510" /NCGR_SAMPLE_ID=MMETSP0890 /ASSEMBLY_ACC=CAM_ASM_000533 /LENGTH=72 /DNA_ID=CAMNT_0042771689 /DNA_START=288 /DNA_END=506 /DNA_ORIENTATION=-
MHNVVGLLDLLLHSVQIVAGGDTNGSGVLRPMVTNNFHAMLAVSLVVSEVIWIVPNVILQKHLTCFALAVLQ